MSGYFGRGDKPDGALKRAQDLINVGNKMDALKLLHDVLTAKRHHRQWQNQYESIMLMYLELCVDLKEHRAAKDGLHQYRNMSQQHGGDSLERVINFYVDLAERRANEARKKADAAAVAAAAAKIADLENDLIPDPESIMLSTMTEDSEKERTDRDIMVPWLKFLWETYRAILEVLRTMQKLEKVYHSTCEKALNFCRAYERSREFHSLCEMLSKNLAQLQRAAPAIGVKDHRLKGWDQWTPESIELHLQTRFKQLDVADALKLWNEGFRIVEDIYTIMQIPLRQPDGTLVRKPQKPRLMATYYDKLTKIFYVSENYLFHAYAWHKYYLLTKDAKAFSAEEKAVQASMVLLAAVCIPPVTDATSYDSSNAFFNEDLIKRKMKNEKLAALLEFNSNPTRQLLLSELLAKNINSQVLPELRELYHKMEVQFAPLQLVASMLPSLAFIRKHPRLRLYVPHLERLLVTRLLKQLSGVYHTVKLSHLQKLISGLEIGFHEVEQLIVKAVKERQVKLRLDHLNQCIHFGEAELEGDTMRYQLAHLARKLNQVSEEYLAPPNEAELDSSRADFFRKVASNMEQQHLATLARKDLIEQQKKDKERERQRRHHLEQQRKINEEKKRQENEERRIEEEQKRREEERKKKEEEQHQLETVQSRLKDLGLTAKAGDLTKLDAEQRQKEIQELMAAQAQAKEEEAKKQKEQARRLDYTVRALRLHETELTFQDLEKKLEAARKEHEARERESDAQRRAQHEAALAMKKRFDPMREHAMQFEDKIRQLRYAEYEAYVAQLRAEHERQHKAKLARARKRKEEVEERKSRQNRQMEEIRAAEAERARDRAEARQRYEAEVAARDGHTLEEEFDDLDETYEDEDDVGPVGAKHQPDRDEDRDDERTNGHDEFAAAAAAQGDQKGREEAEGNGAADTGPITKQQPPADDDLPRKPSKYVPPAARGGAGGEAQGATSWRDRQAAKDREREEQEQRRQAMLRERGAGGPGPADTVSPRGAEPSPRGGGANAGPRRRDEGAEGSGSWRRGPSADYDAPPSAPDRGGYDGGRRGYAGDRDRDRGERRYEDRDSRGGFDRDAPRGGLERDGRGGYGGGSRGAGGSRGFGDDMPRRGGGFEGRGGGDSAYEDREKDMPRRGEAPPRARADRDDNWRRGGASEDS